MSLAHTLDEKKHNVAGWVVSEKLDGMRCVLVNGVAYRRAGNVIQVPDEFWGNIPKTVCFDGELFLGRKGAAPCKGNTAASS